MLDGPFGILLGIEVLTVELMDLCLVRMLLYEDCEQVVDALGGILLGEFLADVTQQQVEFGVHVELLGSEGAVDLLLVGHTVACRVVVLGAGEVDVAVVGLILLGAVQIVECAVGHAVVLV